MHIGAGVIKLQQMTKLDIFETQCRNCVVCRRRAHVCRRLLSVPDVRRQRFNVAGPSGHLPGHGSAAESLLHQLFSQHVPCRQTVRR